MTESDTHTFCCVDHSSRVLFGSHPVGVHAVGVDGW